MEKKPREWRFYKSDAQRASNNSGYQFVEYSAYEALNKKFDEVCASWQSCCRQLGVAIKERNEAIAYGKARTDELGNALVERDEARAQMHKWYNANKPLCQTLSQLERERDLAAKLVEALKEVADCNSGGLWGDRKRLNRIAAKALAEYSKGESGK